MTGVLGFSERDWQEIWKKDWEGMKKSTQCSDT